MSFIYLTARQIWQEHGAGVSEQLFLFPSRRSMLYFKRAMGEAAGRSLWMPDCMTLEEWVQSGSDQVLADAITMTYYLHEAALETGFTQYDFEDFYPLGRVILGDFEEVDMEMIDPDRIWKHTSEFQAADNEVTDPDLWQRLTDSELKERWEVNWNRLRDLYETFHSKLRNEQLTTPGFLYRQAGLSSRSTEPGEYSGIHVIGFSYLTRSEIRILDDLGKDFSVFFYWNIPPQFLEQGLDAGREARIHSENFGNDFKGGRTEPPKVEIIRGNGVLSQMKAMNQILETLETPEEQTAVLLPHPSLIDIFLTSFPDRLSKVNVSLGYPLVYSAARSLLDWIVELWAELEQKEGMVSRNTLLRLWSHTYIQNHVKSRHIELPDRGQLHFRKDQWKQEHDLTDLLLSFSGKQQPLSKLIDILEVLTSDQPDVFQREVLRYVKGRIVRLNDVIAGLGKVSFAFLRKVLFEVLQSASVPFRGEPMEGVQLLGIKEGQNLGFETLFVPGMNEDVLPTGTLKTLIPFSLRKFYGMSDQNDRMRRQAYYLWSAMLNARQVYLFYSDGDDLLGAKGMSRFLFQLKYGDLKIPVTERNLDLELESFEPEQKEVVLTEERREELQRYLKEKGLSATSLITYFRCPFQFYLNYVSGIREEEDPEAGLDAAQMGTVIHDVMEALYLPYTGKKITEASFAEMESRVKEEVHRAYRKNYPADPSELLNSGVHWMEQEIIVRASRRFLAYDRTSPPFEVMFLEKKFDEIVTTPSGPVRLSGKIDRIDRVEGGFRIVDYKTGKSHLTKKSPRKLLEERSDAQNWQLFFYAYLSRDILGETPFEMGHYTLKDKKLYSILKPERSDFHDREIIREFEEVLGEIISEICDPEIPFKQTENEKNCTYCPFVYYCERQNVLKPG